MSAFTELGVAPHLDRRLEELAITQPTAVQKQVIPLLLEKERDLVVQAQTGTGKTAAFGLPLLERIRTGKQGPQPIQALVLAPTRELAQQTGKELFRFNKYCEPKIFIEVVSGGDPIARQIAALQRPTHIIVATPGRLIDLLGKGAVDISKIHTLVLDEADEILKQGFKEQVQSILDSTGATRRATWLFSATLPEGIQRLIQKYMNPDAKRVAIDARSVVNRNISHKYLVCDNPERHQAISEHISSLDPDERGVVFGRTRASVISLARRLEEDELVVGMLHGDMIQKDRDKVMRAFKKGRIQVLVSTDVSARGIDVEGLAFVLHDQLPDQPDWYTHRSGRTGRAGRKGVSIAFIHPRERKKLLAWGRDLGIVFSEI